MAFGERILVEKLDDAKGFAADRQNVHGIVFIALNDFEYLRRAADASNTLGQAPTALRTRISPLRSGSTISR